MVIGLLLVKTEDWFLTDLSFPKKNHSLIVKEKTGLSSLLMRSRAFLKKLHLTLKVIVVFFCDISSKYQFLMYIRRSLELKYEQLS